MPIIDSISKKKIGANFFRKVKHNREGGRGSFVLTTQNLPNVKCQKVSIGRHASVLPGRSGYIWRCCHSPDIIYFHTDGISGEKSGGQAWQWPSQLPAGSSYGYGGLWRLLGTHSPAAIELLQSSRATPQTPLLDPAATPIPENILNIL